MAAGLSKAQIDKLGERLKGESFTGADLRLLNEYRQSFNEAYETVVRIIRDNLGLEPTGKQEKTSGSIAAKLRRQGSMNLSRMQDIAGCRVVVTDIVEQDRVVELLCTTFSGARVVDRRAKPSHGYRAVHVIPKVEGKPVEIQVRTVLQDLWANESETFADLLGDPAIKYGGGDEKIQRLGQIKSMALAEVEKREANCLRNENDSSVERRRDLKNLKNDIVAKFQETIRILERLRNIR
ncbi:hypothetical protein JW916_12240 [Candidatus Sumerlaeota bacterium]|nr:hypothetical protein [Candidatus Sumerlaeota bacterium]